MESKTKPNSKPNPNGHRGHGDNFSSITAVAAVSGTTHCVRGGNGDEFLFPWGYNYNQ